MSAPSTVPALMSPKEASALTSISKSYLAKMALRGEFPQPIQITERRIGFLRSEILGWLNDRVASRTVAA